MSNAMTIGSIFTRNPAMKQLLADFTEGHEAFQGMTEQWIDRALRNGRLALEMERQSEGVFKNHHQLLDSLQFRVEIKQSTFYWYVGIAEHEPEIEAARSGGEILNAKTVRMIIAKPKDQETLTSDVQNDGWIESEPQHFKNGLVTIKPDEGKWGVFNGNNFFCQCPTLTAAKDNARGLLVANANAEKKAAQPTEGPVPVTHAAADHEPVDATIESGDDSDPNDEDERWVKVGKAYVKGEYSIRHRPGKVSGKPWRLLKNKRLVSDHATLNKAKTAAEAHQAALDADQRLAATVQG